jgi:hypothetical protein
MARFNEILAGRYNRFLQKLFGLKGGPPAPQLATEIAPNFQLFSGVENRVLEGWNRFGLLLSITAGAATNSLLRIRNPGNSALIAVLEKLTVANPTAGAVIASVRSGNLSTADAAVLNTPSVTQRWDSRGAPSTALVVSTNAGAVATPAIPGSTKSELIVPPSQAVDFILFEDQEMLILPGDALDVFIGTAAVAMDVSWTWRERSLEESERS